MTEEGKIVQQIDEYLEGLMAEGDRTAFEEKIANDTDLATKVEQVKYLNEAIYFASLADLKEKVGNDVKEIRYTPSSNLKIYVLITSAALIGAALVTYLVHDNNGETSHEKKSGVVQVDSITQKNVIEELSEEKDTVFISPSTTSIKNEPKVATVNTEPLKQKQLSLKDSTVGTNAILDKDKNQVGKNDNEVESEKKSTATILKTVPLENKNKEKIAEPTKTVAKECPKSYQIKTEASCKGKSTGRIEIKSSISTPLNAELVGSVTNRSGVFREVSAGKQELIINYDNNCSFKEVIVVAEKWCPMNQSYSFNPEYNEQWELNYESGQDGSVVIFNSFGKEVYTDDFGDRTVTWAGQDNQGISVPIGTYIAFVNYSDGRKERVELTIVR